MKTTSKYLNEGDTKSFSAVVAIALGEKAAMILQQIHYWVSQRIKEENQVYFHEGFYWIWNSYKEWHRTFPFMPEPTIKRIILDLEQKRVVVSSEFNKNSGNRTKWYRIDHDVLAETVKDAEVYYNSLNVKPSDQNEPPSDQNEPPSDQNEPPSDQNDPTIGSKRSTLSIDLPIDQSSDLANDQTTEDKENIYAPPVEILAEPIQPRQEISIDVLAEEIQETPPPTPAPLSPKNVGLAIATSEDIQKPKKNTLDSDRVKFQPFLDVWLQDKVDDWTPHRVLGKTAISKLKTFVKEHPENALEVFQKGLLYAQTDSYHKTTPKGWDFEEYMSNEKPYRNYKKWEQQQSRSQQSPTDRPMTPSDLKNAETFVRLKERLNKELLTA